MTLTELRYIVALARERHFGRAAAACFVSQPTLSVSIKKFEQELGITLFERCVNEVNITSLGQAIVYQAQQVLEQAAAIKETAKQGKDPLVGPLKVGVIHTIGPYLLPILMQHILTHLPQMPLLLQENYTGYLLELLRDGELDCMIAAEPLPNVGLTQAALYSEDFWVALPKNHKLSHLKHISVEQLKDETLLLLAAEHCLRDQVIEVCPNAMRLAHDAAGIRKSFDGSSLETIKYMVAAGMGITVVPALSVPTQIQSHIHFIPFCSPVPARRVTLVWRTSFTRHAAIEALRAAIFACSLKGVTLLAA